MNKSFQFDRPCPQAPLGAGCAVQQTPFLRRIVLPDGARRHILRALLLVPILLLSMAPANATQQGPDRAVGSASGQRELRLALFGPQYSQDAQTGAVRGDVHLVETASTIASQMQLTLVLKVYPTVPALLAGLQEGSADVAFLGVDPALTSSVVFSNPVFELDYGLLVPEQSTVRTIDDVDRRGLRVAVARNHPSTLAFTRWAKQVAVVVADTPDQALALLQRGEADALASTANAVLAFSSRWPGSRVVEGRYGFAPTALAISRDQAARLGGLNAALEEAKRAGAIQRAIDRGTVRGLRAAPPGGPGQTK